MKRYIAEIIGTFVLVLFGCGSAVFAGDSLGVLGIAFAFGLSIVAMAYSIGTVSGAHLNPAVSLAMFINKRMSFSEFIGYSGSQIFGALLGTGVISLILSFSGMPMTQFGQNFWGNLGAGGAFIVEFILTAVFVLVIVAVTGKKGNSNFAGLVIGLTLVLIHVLGIKLTGTSVNPARSLGPAIFAGGEALSQVWVFILAPLLGGALAAKIGSCLLGTETEE